MRAGAVFSLLPRNHAAKINTVISSVYWRHRFRHLSDEKLT